MLPLDDNRIPPSQYPNNIPPQSPQVPTWVTDSKQNNPPSVAAHTVTSHREQTKSPIQIDCLPTRCHNAEINSVIHILVIPLSIPHRSWCQLTMPANRMSLMIFPYPCSTYSGLHGIKFHLFFASTSLHLVRLHPANFTLTQTPHQKTNRRHWRNRNNRCFCQNHNHRARDLRRGHQGAPHTAAAGRAQASLWQTWPINPETAWVRKVPDWPTPAVRPTTRGELAHAGDDHGVTWSACTQGRPEYGRRLAHRSVGAIGCAWSLDTWPPPSPTWFWSAAPWSQKCERDATYGGIIWL